MMSKQIISILFIVIAVFLAAKSSREIIVKNKKMKTFPTSPFMLMKRAQVKNYGRFCRKRKCRRDTEAEVCFINNECGPCDFNINKCTFKQFKPKKDNVVQDNVEQDNMVQQSKPEKDYAVQNYMEDDNMVQNYMEDDNVEEDNVVQDYVVEDYVEQDNVVEDYVVEDNVEEDNVVEDYVEQDNMEKDNMVQDYVKEDYVWFCNNIECTKTQEPEDDICRGKSERCSLCDAANVGEKGRCTYAPEAGINADADEEDEEDGGDNACSLSMLESM